MKNIAIILASGTGSRSGLDIPKQFFKINNKTLLEYSIEAFNKNKNIDEIIVVSHSEHIDTVNEIIKKNNYTKVGKTVVGGATRQESSFNGISSISDLEAKVLIHDAVRPFVSQRIINDCITSLQTNKAVNVAIETSDTIIEIDNKSCLKSTLKRNSLRRVQTPQGFDLDLIKQAHKMAIDTNNFKFTDDCGLIEFFELEKIKVIEGDIHNIKITYPQDLKFAEFLINFYDKI